MSLRTPPPLLTALVLHIAKVYKLLYVLGNKLSKRDKLGIHRTIEKTTLRILSQTLHATFAHGIQKIAALETLRIDIEALKLLIRTEHELRIISEKTYFILSHHCIEASKMTNGWLKSLKNKTPHRVF